MSIVPVVCEPNPPLRRIARAVEPQRDISALIQNMRDSMRAANGIGIAAPQIGESLRVFLVEPEFFSSKGEERLHKAAPATPPAPRNSDILAHWVFINPMLMKKSFKQETIEEGCLSTPRMFGMVKRPVSVTVEAYDATWKKFRVRGRGLLARVLLHELDHLDGTLFIDKTVSGTLHEYIPENDQIQSPNAKPKPRIENSESRIEN